MSVPPSPQRVEEHREHWASIARKNGWYKQPFFVQVWADSKGEIADSVSFQGLEKDHIELVGDFAHCSICDSLIDLDFDLWTCDDYDTYCGLCK